jgi:hypothetical protein
MSAVSSGTISCMRGLSPDIFLINLKYSKLKTHLFIYVFIHSFIGRPGF